MERRKTLFHQPKKPPGAAASGRNEPEGNEPGCRLSEPGEPSDTDSSVVRDLERDLNFAE